MSAADNPRVFVPPPLMFALGIAMGVLVDGDFRSWHRVAEPLHLAGLLVALAGLALIAVTLGLFRRFRTRPEPWQPASSLITTGVYRLSRNPMYAGMALLSAGIALYFASIAAGIGLLIVVAIIDWFVIRREERYLAARFGADYDGYRARVRRWL